jgi:hypothetical protein
MLDIIILAVVYFAGIATAVAIIYHNPGIIGITIANLQAKADALAGAIKKV